MSKKIGLSKKWVFIGIILGLIVGFMVRPAVSVDGKHEGDKVSFKAVITRGATLNKEEKKDLGSTAKKSFNIMLLCGVIGGLLGFGLDYKKTCNLRKERERINKENEKRSMEQKKRMEEEANKQKLSSNTINKVAQNANSEQIERKKQERLKYESETKLIENYLYRSNENVKNELIRRGIDMDKENLIKKLSTIQLIDFYNNSKDDIAKAELINRGKEEFVE